MSRSNIAHQLREHRGVSPVLGVILLVAVTVILSATIGVFALNLGEDTSETAQAGVSTSDDTITLVDSGNLDHAYVTGPAGKVGELTAAGDTVDGLTPGEYTVIGVVDGEEQVLQTTVVESPDGQSISRWRFDEGDGDTAFDSWNSNYGTLIGPTYTTDAKVGDHALSFSSSDEYVSYGDRDELDLGTGEFTITVWVNSDTDLSSNGRGNAILTKGDHLVAGGHVLYLDDTDGWRYIADESAVDISLGGAVSTDWTFLTVRRTGDTFELMVDGTTVATGSGTADLNTDREFRVGFWTDGGGKGWTGVIDDPRIYDEALSDEEIADVMDETE